METSTSARHWPAAFFRTSRLSPLHLFGNKGSRGKRWVTYSKHPARVHAWVTCGQSSAQQKRPMKVHVYKQALASQIVLHVHLTGHLAIWLCAQARELHATSSKHIWDLDLRKTKHPVMTIAQFELQCTRVLSHTLHNQNMHYIKLDLDQYHGSDS